MAFFLSLHPTALRKTKGEDYVCEHHEMPSISWFRRGLRDRSSSADSQKGHGQTSTTRASNPLPPPLGGPDPAKASPNAPTPSQDAKPDNSLWACAYQDLARNDPKLIQKLNECLKINLSENGTGDLQCSEINLIVHDAIEEIATIPIILASKDLIGLVLLANPYAALAWSSVSLLLPLLLNPSQEREAAQKGLNYVVVLMEVYRWNETSYIRRDNVPGLQRRIVRLYVLLLEYQATLLINLHRKAPAQWARAVFESGDWSSRVKDIQGQDAHCKDLINAVTGSQTIDWRDEERRWQRELLQQPRR
ncbi:MAG: hypothetical protein L6R37_008017 [Teloschistes peruensis]|nr:MAG: hypothetical protein L6R37_008017 [Teloschistes peruensis]